MIKACLPISVLRTKSFLLYSLTLVMHLSVHPVGAEWVPCAIVLKNRDFVILALTLRKIHQKQYSGKKKGVSTKKIMHAYMHMVEFWLLAYDSWVISFNHYFIGYTVSSLTMTLDSRPLRCQV